MQSQAAAHCMGASLAACRAAAARQQRGHVLNGPCMGQRTAVLVLAALNNGQVDGLGHVEAHGAGQVADFIAAVVRTRIMFLRVRQQWACQAAAAGICLHAGVATVGVHCLGANEWVRMCVLGFFQHIALLTCGLHAADPASTAS